MAITMTLDEALEYLEVMDDGVASRVAFTVASTWFARYMETYPTDPAIIAKVMEVGRAIAAAADAMCVSMEIERMELEG